MDVLKFAISSHKDFKDRTYPVLIPSLIRSGVDPGSIYVFVGGCDSQKNVVTGEGVNLYYVNHNSMDFTALISILDLSLQSDYWFLLHDTCRAGEDFFTSVYHFFYKKRPFKTARLYRKRSMNIGIYSHSYLLSQKDVLMSFKNSDYSEKSLLELKKIAVEKEDILLKEEPILNLSQKSETSSIDYYNSGTERIVEYYEDVDLYKIKSNWTIKSQYSITI